MSAPDYLQSDVAAYLRSLPEDEAVALLRKLLRARPDAARVAVESIPNTPAPSPSPERRVSPESIDPAEYLESMVRTLRDHRPELLRPVHGSWQGPEADPRTPAGIFWWSHGHKVLTFASPWDAGAPDLPGGTHAGLWLHVSVSRRDRCPSYEELTEVRDRLFRATDTVLHVWPPRDEHFSLHPNCLHLWTPMDGSRPIPDLRGVGGGV